MLSIRFSLRGPPPPPAVVLTSGLSSAAVGEIGRAAAVSSGKSGCETAVVSAWKRKMDQSSRELQQRGQRGCAVPRAEI